VHTGQVLTERITRNNAATFTRFLRLPDQTIHPSLTIHVVLNNGSSHTAKATPHLAAHPRFRSHQTPKHASWPNHVELFFST
jgi:transposase